MEVIGQTMLQLSVMSLGGLKPEAQLGLLLGGGGGKILFCNGLGGSSGGSCWVKVFSKMYNLLQFAQFFFKTLFA